MAKTRWSYEYYKYATNVMWRKEASKQEFLGNTRSYFISLTSSTGHRVQGVYKNMKEHFHEQGENSFASVIKSDLSQIFLTAVQLLCWDFFESRICHSIATIILVVLIQLQPNMSWRCPKGNQRLTFTHVKLKWKDFYIFLVLSKLQSA